MLSQTCLTKPRALEASGKCLRFKATWGDFHSHLQGRQAQSRGRPAIPGECSRDPQGRRPPTQVASTARRQGRGGSRREGGARRRARSFCSRVPRPQLKPACKLFFFFSVSNRDPRRSRALGHSPLEPRNEAVTPAPGANTAG